jgi:hypothetical protein
MKSFKEIAIYGGGTFAVVCVAALLALPKPATPTSAPTPAPAAQPIHASDMAPDLVEIGTQPPAGVEADSAYIKRQIEAFISARNGSPLAVINAIDTSGSQRTEYCGTARPETGGPVRSFSIVVWSNAPIEHTISNEPADCSEGLALVRNGQAVPWEVARDEQETRLLASQESQPHANTATVSASDPMYDHIDRISTYAVLIGRGAACGVDVSEPARRVGVWLDRVAPPGSAAQQTLLPMLTQQGQYHAQQQSSGRSPDDCATVARAIARFQWP